MRDLTHCTHCQYRGAVLYAHDPPPPWLPLLALTGVGLLAVVLRTSATRRACPRCRRHDGLEPLQGDADADSMALLQAALADNDEAVRRSWRRTWLTLAIAAPLLVAALVAVFRHL